MKVCFFPGQGAQRLGMGADSFDRFAELTVKADGILGYSMRDLCLNGPMDRLTQTQFTQPALYVVNALQYLKTIEDNEGQPDYLMGHSVSEYVALFAAGVLNFEDGLRLVQKRGELMQKAKGGGMAAVVGLDADKIEKIIRENALSDIYAANYNTPSQIVVSGKADTVAAAESLFMAEGAILYKVLAVSGAFHTPFMNEAQNEFADFAKDISFASPKIPVISNVTARPHDGKTIRDTMIQQITQPVRWSESIRYLLAKGVEPENFVEIGPKGPPILKPMVIRTKTEAGPLDLNTIAAEETVQPCVKKRTSSTNCVSVESLGSSAFCEEFSLRYPCMSGSMYRGIASPELVIRMAKAGMLGFIGAGGMSLDEVEKSIAKVQASVSSDMAWGVNFISHFNRPEAENALTDTLLRLGVTIVEASAFMEVSPALVRYRAKGLSRVGGRLHVKNKIIAKVSRPDIAAQFLAPASTKILDKMLADGVLNADEVELLRHVPMVDAITVESDSGGHTDQGMPFALIPAVLKVRDDACSRFPDFGPIFVGAGGGIGTPEAVAATFMLGVDYILTGSINQCSVEAGTSDVVKDLLEVANVYDMAYAPSGAMFELGAKVQVLKKGLFFPSRAEKLVAMYHQHASINDVDAKLRKQIEERYFRRSLDDVLSEIQSRSSEKEWAKMEKSPKYKMGQIIRRYFSDTTRWALSGDLDYKVDFQIHSGPAQGAFNQWVKGTKLENWRSRHVDVMAIRLLEEAADILNQRIQTLIGKARS